jgi:hypothetical protein
MSVSILDEVVAELHMKHGEEAEHILPEHRVGTAHAAIHISIMLGVVCMVAWIRLFRGVTRGAVTIENIGQGCEEPDPIGAQAGTTGGQQQEVLV